MRLSGQQLNSLDDQEEEIEKAKIDSESFELNIYRNHFKNIVII
jgi:hypothetical protein